LKTRVIFPVPGVSTPVACILARKFRGAGLLRDVIGTMRCGRWAQVDERLLRSTPLHVSGGLRLPASDSWAMSAVRSCSGALAKELEPGLGMAYVHVPLKRLAAPVLRWRWYQTRPPLSRLWVAN